MEEMVLHILHDCPTVEWLEVNIATKAWLVHGVHWSQLAVSYGIIAML